MTPYASLPDAELVPLARAGERPAFAVLFHRHVGAVYDTIRTSAPDGTVARRLTVAAFSDALRHLDRLDPEQVRDALIELGRRRAAGHTPGAGVPALTVGAVDAIWRELDARWPTGEPPRREPGLTAAVTIGALVAVLILGAMAASSPRSGTPDPGRTFEAASLDPEPTEPTDGLVVGLPRPRETDAEAGPSPDATEATAEPTATPTATEPTPEPTATEPTPAPTATEEPDAAPEVTISSPNDGETRGSEGTDEQGAYATFTLDGAATDDRDPPEALGYSWTSSIDGALLDGPSGSVRLHVPEGALTAQHQVQLRSPTAPATSARPP